MTSVEDRGATRTSRLVRALLYSPFVILIASGTRLLLIGNYDTTTATAIAAAGGVVGTLLGTIVPLLPSLLPIICLGMAVARKLLALLFVTLATDLISTTYAPLSEAQKDAWESFRGFIDRSIGLDWAAMWHYWPLAASCGAIGLMLTIWDPPPGLKVDLEEPILSIINLIPRLPVGLVVAAICALVALLSQNLYSVPRDLAGTFSQGHYRDNLHWDTVSAIVRRPWVPAEEITLKSGLIVVGYTLSTKDKWFVVLKDYDRTIDYIFADDVANRKVCTLGGGQLAQAAPLIKFQGVHIAKIEAYSAILIDG